MVAIAALGNHNWRDDSVDNLVEVAPVLHCGNMTINAISERGACMAKRAMFPGINRKFECLQLFFLPYYLCALAIIERIAMPET